jgi:probable HAF family extracellular repeat protein
VNKSGHVVGTYTDANGGTHGFIWNQGTFQTVDDPDGMGTTIINGINNRGDIVGFFVDADGNTDGFVGKR